MIPGRPSVRALHSRKPRASGDDPQGMLGLSKFPWVNPARAGMIPRGSTSPASGVSKPRASGDDPCSESPYDGIE